MSAHPAASSTTPSDSAPTPNEAPAPEKSQLVEKSHNFSTASPTPTLPTPPLPTVPETPIPDPQLDPQQLIRRHTKPLSPQQLAAIDLLVAGRSDAKAAAAIGVVRETVTRWRLYNHVFQAELNRRRQETWGAAGDRLRKTLSKAVTVFRNQLVSDHDLTAFRAARALLQLAGSSRLVRPPDPDTAPPDPASVLEVEARKCHIELHSIDSRTDPIYDDERALALRRLLHRNHVDPRGAAEEERP